MLMPKRTKYRKIFRPRKVTGQGAARVDHRLRRVRLAGDGNAWISARQIEAGRRAITNYLKRGGKVWIRIFPDKAITQKPAETRMGSGKGSPEYWVAWSSQAGSSMRYPGFPRIVPRRPFAARP